MARTGHIAITPDGKTAYVANDGSDTVTPINTATNTAGPLITTGTFPWAIAITPDGKTRLRLQYRLALGHPDQHRYQHRRPPHQDRGQPHRHRDHAGREDRLRRQ